MTKIDVISGFLGAGKTTLINRLIKEAYQGEKIVLIENEFGQIGVDGAFLQDAGVQITEMNSGCICCSLVGDFSKALRKVVAEYAPDRILIEPSGVGKLSDVTRAVLSAGLENVTLNSSVVVVDVNKCKMYMKNFGEFFNDQIANAGCILFSHTDKTTDEKLAEALKLVREQNPTATIVTTPADHLDIQTLKDALEQVSTLQHHLDELMEEEEEDTCPVCGGHHHHHDHDHDEDHEHCHEHHHDDDDDDDDEHEHHHHHDDDDDDGDEHEHHHHDGEECHCHDHDHEHNHEHHHHHHHADEIFTSWGQETVRKYSAEEMKEILSALGDEEKYGIVLRSKGILPASDGEWIYFDYVPGEPDIRRGSSAAIGKICVIGSGLHEEALRELFRL